SITRCARKSRSGSRPKEPRRKARTPISSSTKPIRRIPFGTASSILARSFPSSLCSVSTLTPGSPGRYSRRRSRWMVTSAIPPLRRLRSSRKRAVLPSNFRVLQLLRWGAGRVLSAVPTTRIQPPNRTLGLHARPMNRPLSKAVRISIDAMGGDHGPEVVVPGAAISHDRHPDTEFIFLGDEKRIAPLVAKEKRLKNAAKIVHTDIAVKMDDKPSQALRHGRRN